jgi:hypothetical protein
LATVPDTANVGLASVTGATSPVLVTDVLTVPCCTVDVSCVLAAEELLGAMRRKMPAPRTTMMVAKATVIHTRRLIFMTRASLSKIGERYGSNFNHINHSYESPQPHL